MPCCPLQRATVLLEVAARGQIVMQPEPTAWMTALAAGFHSGADEFVGAVCAPRATTSTRYLGVPGHRPVAGNSMPKTPGGTRFFYRRLPIPGAAAPRF